MRKSGFLQIIALSGMILLQCVGLAQDPSRPDAPDNLQISFADRLKVFDKAWETVNRNYWDPKFSGVNWVQMKEKYRPLAGTAIDKVQLADVIQRMLSELHVSHMSINGGFQYGTGAGAFKMEGEWIVHWIAPDSPAQRAGMERGWILRGSEGDCVGSGRKVSAQYQDLKSNLRSVELSCGAYRALPVPTDNFQALEKGAVYLRLTSFTSGPGNWLAEQVERNRSAKAIVLDLRNNWGGAAEIEEKVFNLFLSDEKVIGKFRDRKGKETTLKVKGSKSAYPGQLIVLTDAYTGSAAEVFAAGIQETGRGVVVGQLSKKGVLGATHFKLPNGFDLHVAIWDYHTVNGVRLEGRGVIPNVVVDLTIKDFRENRDAVLDRVKQLL